MLDVAERRPLQRLNHVQRDAIPTGDLLDLELSSFEKLRVVGRYAGLGPGHTLLEHH
jgi:hypothetical protein